jgi:hypothetical protein
MEGVLHAMFLNRLKIAAVALLALGALALGAALFTRPALSAGEPAAPQGQAPARDQEPRPEKVRDEPQRLRFVLRKVDPARNTIAVTIPGTKLQVNDLRVAKDARILLNGKAARLADLQKGAGKPITIALGADGATATRIEGVWADAAELDRLVAQLGSANFPERHAATQALEAIGEPAREALYKAAMTNKDPEVRRRAEDLVLPLISRALQGVWYDSDDHKAPPDPVKECAVLEWRDKLYLINESGEKVDGRVALLPTHVEIQAPEWGDLTGKLVVDKEGTRIFWSNNTKWTKKQGP